MKSMSREQPQVIEKRGGTLVLRGNVSSRQEFDDTELKQVTRYEYDEVRLARTPTTDAMSERALEDLFRQEFRKEQERRIPIIRDYLNKKWLLVRELDGYAERGTITADDVKKLKDEMKDIGRLRDG